MIPVWSMRRTALITVILLTSSVSAVHAQYYEYGSDKPSVEMSLDALDNPPLAAQIVETHPLAPLQITPTASQRVSKPFFTRKLSAPASISSMKEKPLPPSAPVSTPAPKMIAHPAPPVAAPKPLPLPTPPEHAASVHTPTDITLNFDGNSSGIPPQAQEKLEALVKQLSTTSEARLQIRAYATGEDGNTSSARRISLSRALSVRSYLMDKGLKPNRVDVRALGAETDHTPLDRVDLVFIQ